MTFTLQVKVLSVIEAVNCCEEPARTFAVEGEIVSVSVVGGAGLVNPAGVRAQLEVISANITVNPAQINERRTVASQNRLGFGPASILMNRPKCADFQ